MWGAHLGTGRPLLRAPHRLLVRAARSFERHRLTESALIRPRGGGEVRHPDRPRLPPGAVRHPAGLGSPARRAACRACRRWARSRERPEQRFAGAGGLAYRPRVRGVRVRCSPARHLRGRRRRCSTAGRRKYCRGRRGRRVAALCPRTAEPTLARYERRRPPGPVIPTRRAFGTAWGRGGRPREMVARLGVGGIESLIARAVPRRPGGGVPESWSGRPYRPGH